MSASAAENWARIVASPEHDYSLAEAALAIASEEYPQLDSELYLRRLDAFAERATHILGEDATAEKTIVAINQVMYTEEGFGGNTLDYYDPRNSYLNEVMDRKLGIPITLSIIYLEIGHRLELSMDGVSFPGHFLVKCRANEHHIILDPFAKGRSLSLEQLDWRLRQICGEAAPSVKDKAELLRPATKKQVLIRLLRNLKNIFNSCNAQERTLSIIDKILQVYPDSTEEIRERAMLYEKFGCYRTALVDLERYRDLVQSPTDDDVEDAMQRLRLALSSYH